MPRESRLGILPPYEAHFFPIALYPCLWSSLSLPLSPCLRFQKTYRELAKKHPSFRERSETTELIVEISLQPWNSFHPDGVILFSDILTPLPALGVQVGEAVQWSTLGWEQGVQMTPPVVPHVAGAGKSLPPGLWRGYIPSPWA